MGTNAGHCGERPASIDLNHVTTLNTKTNFYSIQRLSLYCIELKGKADPLEARRGPEGSRKLKFPDFVTTAQDGGKVVSLTHRPLLPTGNAPGTHFC